MAGEDATSKTNRRNGFDTFNSSSFIFLFAIYMSHPIIPITMDMAINLKIILFLFWGSTSTLTVSQ